MGKVIYKTVDPRGRITIPCECRKQLNLSNNDIVRIELSEERPVFSVTKMDIIDVNKEKPEVAEEYIMAAMKTIPACRRVVLASMLLESVRGGK